MDWTIGLLDYISSYFWDHFLGPFFWINFWTILWGGGGGGQTSSAWGREGPEIP